jgi:hypothetical protein
MEATMLYGSAEERVARGVAFLDEHAPGWRDKVEINDLRMQDSCRCVLGQVFNDEDGGESRGYYWASDKWLLAGGQAARLGFDAGYGMPFEALQAAWLEELAR